MAWQVVNLPALIPTTTGAGAVTNFIGSLDDAESITIFMVSTANGGSSGATGLTIQVTQWDPATTPTPPTVHHTAAASGTGQVCTVFYVYDPSANVSTGASVCSGCAFATNTLAPAPLTLPIDGAATIDIAAQNGGEAHVLALSWTASGV